MNKYSAAIIAGLIVFSGLILSTCEKRQNDVYAVVNGIDIRGQDFLTPGNREDKEKMRKDLDALIEKKVIETEVQKLNTTENDLFSFFDSLKTREIPNEDLEKVFKAEFRDQGLGQKSKDSMLSAVREKQYDMAKKKYIYELKTRSTILLVDDEGEYHTYPLELN